MLPIHVYRSSMMPVSGFHFVAEMNSGTPSDYLDEWWKLPFILVIDEIENHLHPTWQRRVIPALLEYFPNVQIIATTHSPFVVAGLKKGAGASALPG